MLNRLIFSAFVAFAGCLSLYSETSVCEYTYADGELMPYGTSRTETFDVAMCIDNPALVGFKVTSVKAYLNAWDGIEKASLWMSDELKLVKKVNSPNIWSSSVEVEKGVYVDPADGQERTVGILEFVPAEPYELKDSSLYVGYSIEVTNIDNDELKNPILLSKGQTEGSFFFHSNKSVIHWTNYSEKTGAAAVICLTLEKESSEASLGIRTIYPTYAAENEDFVVDVEVCNTGNSPVKSVSYRYIPDDGTGVKESIYEIQDPIVPDLVRTPTLSLKIEGLPGLGSHEFPIEITEVNGLPNESPAMAGNLELTVIPFVPKRRLLIEEYTGLWCKFCIRGYIGMELISERYADDQVSICFHNNDAMMVTSEYPIEVAGYPLASINRALVLDPYYGNYQDLDFGIRKDIEESLWKLTMADIDVSAILDGNKVLVESAVRFIKDMNDCDYQIGYVLTCDGMSDPTWFQSNAYSGTTGLEGTHLEQAAEWPSRVGGLVFNDVAVDVAGMNGLPGSLPKDMYMGDVYGHSYSFDLSRNNLVTSTDDLNVVAFIVNKATGEIVNANKACLGNVDGIDEISDSSEVVSTDYYDMMGRKINCPAEGIVIRIDRLADGRMVSTKILH